MEKTKNRVVIETEKDIIVTDKETLEVLKGIKKGLDDFEEGRFTVENY